MFFHSFCHAKSMWMHIYQIQNSSGQWIEEEGEIAREAVDYFQKLFSASNSVSDSEDILSCIPSMISSSDNLALDRLPSLREIWEAVFSLDKNNAPVPMGFQVLSFSTVSLLWEVIFLQLLGILRQVLQCQKHY